MPKSKTTTLLEQIEALAERAQSSPIASKYWERDRIIGSIKKQPANEIKRALFELIEEDKEKYIDYGKTKRKTKV